MKVLFVFAHPDDESFSSGGTIAKLAKQGHTVKLITATKGEAGQTGGLCRQEELGRVREKELRNAAKVLGISQIFFLGLLDGTLSNVPVSHLADKVLAILKKEKPDTVLTFDKHGGSNHPDHKAMSVAGTQAFNTYIKSAKKPVRLYHTAVPKSYLAKYREKGLDYKAFGDMIGTADSEITTVIDIKDSYPIKVKAFKSHKTQQKDWGKFLKRSSLVDLKKEFFELIRESDMI